MSNNVEESQGACPIRDVEEMFRAASDSLASSDEKIPDEVGESNGERFARCWEHRGCVGKMGLTDFMSEECPHSRQDCYSPCPAECKYTVCSRPWHKTATGFDLILDPTVDRMAAIKQVCYTCEHFLKHGPRVGEGASDGRFKPDAATKDSDSSVTIHLF